MTIKEEGQEYAQVSRLLGNNRVECICFDGQTRLGHICGRIRKKVWINVGDIVLVGLRDFQDAKCDVMLKYNADEARKLKQRGELPDNVELNKTDKGAEVEDDVPFDFGEI